MIKPIFVKFLVVACFLSLSVFADSGINRNNDFQVWLYQSFAKEIRPKTTFTLEGEIRYGADASIAYFAYLQGFLAYRVSSFFLFAPGYRQSFRYVPAEDKWINVYNPLLDLVFEKTIKKWKVIDRNRFQYVIPENDQANWLYRNRVTLVSPFEIGVMKFNPQFYDEVFLDQFRGFVENRLGIGGRLKFSKNWQSNLSYVLRHLKREHWTRQHIMYLQLFYTF